VPDHLRRIWWVRHLDKVFVIVVALAALTLPLVVTASSRHLLYTTILAFAICAMSLTVLTGWAGQLSLGQMAFAGLGALTAAALTRGVTISVGDQQVFELYPMPFALAIVVAAVAMAALAVVIGIGALRVRGILLAVSTFAFALAAQQYLYRRPLFTGGSGSTVPFPRGELLGLDLASQRTWYYVVLAVLAVTALVLTRLRRGGIGRTTIAVRDNPDSAAAYTVRASGAKLRSFALAGGLAGLGGALLAGTVQSVPFTERFFLVQDSLNLVAMVVIGGLGSVAGAVLGAIWVVGLPAFFPNDELVPLVTSSVGLLVLLLYFPGGLAQIGFSARAAIIGWLERRIDAPPSKAATTVPAHLGKHRQRPGGDAPALSAEDVRVHFGGVAAVDGVSLDVRPGEVIGLIGTNGAGKSTLMNAIGGYVPSTGAVRLHGTPLTGRSAAARAALGLGRTFQAARLFPELTVRDTVLVALEGRHRTGLLSEALALPPARRRERAARAEAAELIDFLGLGRYADRYLADLSTGTRRIVELAGLLALDAHVLCLDEPTAGVAQRETEAFGPVITDIRRELDASMLIVEHDMPLIMSISDRVYCLEAGRVIAEGPPDAVRNDPAVVASYLGTEERAIARSGPTT
jgi:ABC-type branched-subunit amino acid transport system ATPase component/ABC-type branched-subunit amino acid transport system permease subunit